MSKLNFLSDNLVVDNNVDFSMVVGTENANFPLTNMQRKFTTKKFRSNENTCEVLIDLGQTKPIDCFMVVGDALTGLGVSTISIQGSATMDFTGVTPIDITINQEFNIGYAKFAEQSVRFWKINLTNTGSFCELSNIFIGKAEVIQNNSISISSFRFGTTDLSRTSVNDYGQEFTDKRSSQKDLSGTIQYCNNEETKQIDDIILKHSDRTPVWIILDQDNNITDDGEFRFSGYYSIQNRPRWSATGYGLFNINLTFKQVI